MEQHDSKPTVGITIGDFNGIGPEVIIKTFADNRILKVCKPIIYGSGRIFSKYKKILQIESFMYQQIHSPEQAQDKKVNLINCWEDNLEVEPGVVSQEAGRAAYLALARSTEDLKNRTISAIVTAPINKKNIQSPDFQFAGHTEYYASHFSKDESLMLLISEVMRVGAVTTHIPLQKVAENITQEKIVKKINILIKSLKEDFGIRKPRIAVLGLNPHAGEEGLLGSEEINSIQPVIQQLKDRGNLIYGVFPADGFFGMGHHKKFDAVLAMYHDQGLVPFKMMSFEDGVNFTAGLSIIRTSPDHGTAYDIAGKGVADENSMRSAIFLACDIAKHRYWSKVEKDSREREKDIKEKEREKFRGERAE